MEQYIFFIIIIVAVVSSIGYSFYSTNKRKKIMIELAKNLGYEYFENIPNTYFENSGLKIFTLGRGRKILSMLKKEINSTTVFLIDYTYTTGSGKNSKVHTQTILLFKSNTFDLTDFILSPENIFNKIGSAFGYQDIDFEEYPKFSSQYLLRGKNEEAIRKLFNNEVLNFFTERKKINVEGNGSLLAYYRASKKVALKDINYFLEEGEGIYNIFRGLKYD